jgi:nitrite reductase/ring-hydroxylating ferredoxin subunit/uncharacterized membrane protein
MSVPEPVRLAEQQEWTEPLGDALSSAIDSVVEAGGEPAREIKNCLHGTWLGHPLHPALVTVPIGAWTAALVMDVLDTAQGEDRYAAGADAAVGVGLAGAVGAALAGLMDWHHTDGRARKIGMVHGVLNLTAAALYGGSLLLRRNGSPGAGRGLGFVGYGLVMASGYLGGHLVGSERVGVNHALEQAPPEEFTAVLPEEELPEGVLVKVEAGGAPVLLARVGGRICALADTCAHLGGPLSEGELKDGTVTCPWHGSCFALEDGRVVDGPSAYPQPRYETRVRDGQIEVRSSSE